MRKIVNLFEKGNLTPRERYLMLMQNDLSKALTGEESLTQADKGALENWKPVNNYEVDEWNKYAKGDGLITQAGLEAEFIYSKAQTEYSRKFFLDTQLSFYPFNQRIEDFLERLEKNKTVNEEDDVLILKKILNSMRYIREIKENDEIILDFTSETARMIFKEARNNLIDCYAKLLAFQKIFKKISIIYEVDLVHFINDHLENVARFLEENNEALSKTILKMKDNLFIDKDSILPDTETLEIWNEKFTDILGNEF
jgi:hypothetical protein